MHQHNFRDKHNRYLHQLARLNQLSDVTGVPVPLLVRYLDRLRYVNQAKEAQQALTWKTGISEELTD